MSHPYQSHREKHPGQKKARERVKERSAHSGGFEPEAKATGGPVKAASVKELKVGGAAGGARLDKFARGGKAKGRGKKNHTHININVAPKSPDVDPGLMPPPAAGPAGPPPGPPMGGPPMGAPMGGPPGAPPGGPPGQPLPPPMKRGGKVNVKGGDNGVGRLSKKNAYGLKAKG